MRGSVSDVAGTKILKSKKMREFVHIIVCTQREMVDLKPYPRGQSEAQFLVLDWGNKVDSGKGWSYRPTRLHMLAGWYDKPMPYSTLSPSQRLRIWLKVR
jgi:hypothetical protein